MTEPMEPLPAAILRRWTRYGHDRMYATLQDGTKLGFRDLKTGEITPEEGVNIAYLARVFDAGEVPTPPREVPSGASPQESQIPPPPTLPMAPATQSPQDVDVAEASYVDLVHNAPGSAVRTQAQQTWEERKERSKFLAYAGRALDLHTDERAWRVGAAGEERVGARLNKLWTHGWGVLHSVPVGKNGSDIDHVLIGPGGVFTVNTKNHPGAKIWVGEHQIRVNGAPVPYLRNSRHEATRASALLTAAVGFQVNVHAALVLLTGGLQPNIDYKRRLPRDVLVCDMWDLPRIFKRRKGVLSEEEIARIFDVARRSTTWTGR